MRAIHDSLTESERTILDDIEAEGVHVVHVGGEGDDLEYSFSVGLWHSFEQPEVIVFGLPTEIAEDLIQAIADDASDGKLCLAGSQNDGLIQSVTVRFFEVPKPQYRDYLGEAVWAYENDDFPAVQLVWPDKQGRWPWEEDVREGFRDSQPVLGRSEPEA